MKMGYLFQKSSLALFATLAISSQAAFATPITWNLNNVVFDNGSVATGSFDFDTATHSYSNINISISAGSGYSATTITGRITSFYSGTSAGAIFANSYNPGAEDIYLGINGGLNTPGATYSIIGGPGGSSIGVCVSTCSSTYEAYSPAGHLSSGTVSSVSAVPLPASAWLFGSGLLGLIGITRKKISA